MNRLSSFPALSPCLALALVASCASKDLAQATPAPVESEPSAASVAPRPPPPPSRRAPSVRRPRGPLPVESIVARVSHPAAGIELAVYAHLPPGEGPHKAVVLVPGASGDASSVLNQPTHIEAMTSRGIAVFKYDPAGRGNSGGADDMGGLVHQEGLRAVIEHVAQREDIADDGVGVLSYSYGIVISSGALSGGATGARFLIDWEGPSSRDYIARCQDGQGQTQPPFPVGFECDDDQFWSEREAVDAIGGLQIPYLRIQRAIDHVHGEDSGHAMELLGAALEGGVPWVRLNDLQPGLDLPALQQAELPDVGFDELFAWFADWTEDMFVVAEGQEPAPRQHVPTTSAAPVRPKGPPARPAPLKRPGQ